MNKQYTESHLSLMLRLRNVAEVYNTLSATKKKLALDLIQANVCKLDTEGFVMNTELGDRVLDRAVNEFSRLITVFDDNAS